MPAGATFRVRLLPLADGRYRLMNARLFSGVYEFRDGHLAVVEPVDRRLTEFAWKVLDADTLVLAQSPPVRKIGADFTGATLRRLTAAATQPTEAMTQPVSTTTTAATSPTTAPELSGAWEIAFPYGRKQQAAIQQMGPSRFLLKQADYLTGLYEVQGDKFVLVDNLGQRISRCTWQIMDYDHLVVIIGPPTREHGPNYSGTTLTRKAP
jgi:hypothetical protein